MLNFKTPELSDKQWLEEITKNTDTFNMDNAFATIYLWRNKYGIKICQYKGFVLKCYTDIKTNNIWYSFPVGTGDYKGVLQQLINHAAENSEKPFQLFLPTDKKDILEELMPNQFEYTIDPDNSEYIYLSENLATLAGRKYHSKRNHINKMKEMYSYTFEMLSEANLKDALYVARKWCEANGCTHDGNGLSSEHCAILESVKHFSSLEMKGGLIRIDDKPVAMTMGSEISPIAFDVNFEKAVPGYDGLYALINKCFAETLTNYKYINREEDMGIEGLRKAKQSYKPAILFEKYSAKMVK